MGFAHRAFVAAGVGFAAAAIVGCGSSGGSLLSASESNTLSEQLNHVTQALDDSNCTLAREYLAEFNSTVNGLGGVNATLISNLNQGASTIQSLANRDCQSSVPTTTTAKTRPRTTTETTATQTTATFTVPTTTTTYTAPSYTTTTYSTPSTPIDTTTTQTQTQTTTSTVNSTTSPTGGSGLGGSTIDTSTAADTTTIPSTTTSTGEGF